MVNPTADLHNAIEREATPAAIAKALAELELEEKIRVVRSLHGRTIQRRLWDTVAENPRVEVSDLVPSDHEPLQPVIFHGKNSLPAFSQFRKICCRPPADATILWGYNDSPLGSLIGPGYYVVHATDDAPLGGAAFDYTVVPESRLRGWPAIRSNHVGVSRFIYDGLIDYMRRVTDDVFIGTATRDGSEIGSYFVVVRELPT